jgi:hypothetical protein
MTMTQGPMFHGVIHGKRIELTIDPGLSDGMRVEVALRPEQPTQPWGDGLRRCAGALGSLWTAADDRILEELQDDRRCAEFRGLPE